MTDSEHIIYCPDCKYYYPPCCVRLKCLPMTSRKGFCYHAVKGKYEGGVPTVETKKNDTDS